MRVRRRELKACAALVLALALSFIAATTSVAQFPKLPKLKIKIPGLDKLFKQKPPITTSLNDALFEIPFLDDYDPADPIAMGVMPRNDDGAFRLFPGSYWFEAESYCLHAGTYAPGEGNGYIYAPLKGHAAEAVRSILRNSVKFPEIPQRKIQLLLWAIIARAKVEDLSDDLRAVASKLLTRKQLLQLNRGALDYIPNIAKSKTFRKLPPALRQVYEAENKIREVMRGPGATYEQVENIAVLVGVPPREKNDRQVSIKRWSYHPNGYFVRFLPFGYSHTRIQAYVPEPFTIERDTMGRITAITDPQGNQIKAEYDEAASMNLPRDRAVAAHAFKLIRFVEAGATVRPDDRIERTWENTGWTLVGVPGGKGKPTSSARFNALTKRYKEAVRRKKQFESVLKQAKKVRGMDSRATTGNFRDMMDLSHFKDALLALVGKSAEGEDRWEATFLDRVANAWQYVFHLEAAGRNATRTLSTDNGPTGSVESGSEFFDPSGTVATPGESRRQRLGQSLRCHAGGSAESQKHLEGPLLEALRANGYNAGPDSVYVYQKGAFPCFMVRLSRNGNPLPTLACIEQRIERREVPEGSVEGARTVLVGCIQQFGGKTRVTAREVDVETGVIGGRGKGDAAGTDDRAVQEAAERAFRNMGAGARAG